MTLPAPDFARDSVDHFAYRTLLEAWLDATSSFWCRRAEQLEAARPRDDDFPGQATRQDLRAQWDRLTAAAEACRYRADYLDASRDQFDKTLIDVGAAV